MRAIYVIGPSSTGKTTLCNALAKRLGLSDDAYIREVARNVMRDKGYTRNDVGSLQMQHDIMNAYFQREAEIENDKQPFALFDRSAIDPVVYAIMTSKSKAEAQARKAQFVNTDVFQQKLRTYRHENVHFILLKPVPQWLVDDGVRNMEGQEECLQIFRELTKELGILCHEFGDEMPFLEERVIISLGIGKF